MLLYWLIKILFKPFAKMLFRLKVEGLKNLPKKGGYILAPNHSSSLDPFLMIASIPRYIRWLIVYEFYDQPKRTWFLKHMRFIRVENNLPKDAFRTLRAGGVLGVFPEGRRTWTGNLGPGRPGAAALARRTGVPVVPVAIQGAFYALPRWRDKIKFTPITIRIGKPLYFPKPQNKKDSAKIDEHNSITIMLAIAKMLD
ncbi:MAG: 1-acyl-sn-glycerol-3-phosphate acyltransferase [Candidatus Omnitrophica bacterium]|nr:1-acyl-sn-glycerol-3-phosphate acyltransferase [Candidatus Omnitrophota bacterium]